MSIIHHNLDTIGVVVIRSLLILVHHGSHAGMLFGHQTCQGFQVSTIYKRFITLDIHDEGLWTFPGYLRTAIGAALMSSFGYDAGDLMLATGSHDLVTVRGNDDISALFHQGFEAFINANDQRLAGKIRQGLLGQAR